MIMDIPSLDDFNRMAWAHENLSAVHTEYVIAYEDGAGPVKIVAPAPRMMAALMHGGIIARKRVIGQDQHGAPVFDGDGKIQGPMTEMEAVEFIGWRDIPRHVNHRAVLRRSQIPQDRTYRNAWRLDIHE